MISRLKCDRIITPEGFFSGYVYWDEQGITQVTTRELPAQQEYDFAGKIVSPGFIDLHVHGGAGFDFSTAQPEEIAQAADLHLQHGTTTIVPTLTSVSFEQTNNALAQIKKCKEAGLCRGTLYGVHLEGPYFSPLQCGAQNPHALSRPEPKQYEALLEKYRELIVRWSYAPEVDSDGTFLQCLTKYGVVPSMGHTAAIYHECMAAYHGGCRLVTHLYSCTSTVTRERGYRRLGVIETAYLLEDMDVEVIADGKHLPPELLRLICKIKGYDHVCLVTDAMKVAGITATHSEIGGVPCVIEDGVAKLLDRSAFAGSVATADRLLQVCVHSANIPVLDAVKMLTENPARILGIDAGRLVSGAPADMVVLNDAMEVAAVFASGCRIESTK